MINSDHTSILHFFFDFSFFKKMHKVEELAHHLCETKRRSLTALATKIIPSSFLVGSYVLQKSDLIPFSDPYAPLIIFVSAEQSVSQIIELLSDHQFTRERYAKGVVFSTMIAVEEIKLFPLHIICCSQPPNDLAFLQGNVLCKKPTLLPEFFYWQTQDGHPIRQEYITSNDYGPQFRRDMRTCLLRMLPFLDEASKKHVSFKVDDTYYDYEALRLLKGKELFLDATKIEFLVPPPETSTKKEAVKDGLMVIMTSVFTSTQLLMRLHPELSAN